MKLHVGVIASPPPTRMCTRTQIQPSTMEATRNCQCQSMHNLSIQKVNSSKPTNLSTLQKGACSSYVTDSIRVCGDSTSPSLVDPFIPPCAQHAAQHTTGHRMMSVNCVHTTQRVTGSAQGEHWERWHKARCISLSSAHLSLLLLPPIPAATSRGHKQLHTDTDNSSTL